MNPDVVISVQQVSKKFRLFNSPKERLAEALHPFRRKFHHEFWALKDISFDVHRGEIVGVLGKNGSGKSTLLQIVCAVMRPTQGRVEVHGRISALLELGAGFNPQFTGRENVLLNGAIMGMSRVEMLKRLPDIETFAEIGSFFDQPVKTYSSGMFVRLAFAAAIHVDPEILIVDEALSVGDSEFQHRCFQRIREFMEQGKTILVVSHSTDTLLRICHRGVVFDAGKLSFAGPIASAVNHYQNLLFGAPRREENALVAPIVSCEELMLPEVASSIGSLSSDIRDRVFEKTGYNSHETRLGDGSATIVDFDVITNGQVNPHEIRPRAEAELIIKVIFRASIRRVSIGFALVTIDGIYVYGTNMSLMRVPLINAERGDCYAVKFKFTASMAGGEYFLNIGCHQCADNTETFLDVRRSVSRIKISDTPRSIGFVDLAVDHEVIRLNAGHATTT